MEKQKFYITTPIYYPSDKLHIGHTYCTVATDAMARYKRLTGCNVLFLTGTDEHGQKIEDKAKEAGVSPKEFVDRIVEGPRGVKDLWKLMNISNDRFIRTTDDYHVSAIQKIFKKMYEKGDIYKGRYVGKYCKPCESFWTESQLVDGKCPDCGRDVQDAEEEAYFFRLSKYADKIQHLLEDTDFLEPRSRVNEMVNNFIKPGLEDLCTASDGNKYIVPIGIHKSNVIFYNIHVFEKYGVEIPDHENITWDEFWSICDQLAAAMPDGEYPIDLGDRKGWPACQVFEDIMMGTDPQIYEDFINGNYNVEDVTNVLSTYSRLMEYVAPDHSSRDWYETSGQLVAGTYAMQIMGAWMQPLMTSMGQVYGEDYGVFTFPGTENWFGMCVDGFVVSNDSADVDAGVRWAYTMSTPQVQNAFSALKESISPYTDTPDETYNELTLKFKNELTAEGTKVYPSFTHGTALPWSASTSLQTQIQEFATSAEHDAEYFANRIVNILKEAGVKGEWNLVD